MLDIIVLLFGILMGIMAGLLPGIGVLIILILSYPIFDFLSAFQVLLFFVSILSTTQYIGSISAIFFGVPGEQSSFPAIQEGHKLFLNNKGLDAIAFTALGSLAGAYLTLILAIILIPFMIYISQMFSSIIQVILLFLATTLLLISSRNKLYWSIFLFSMGYIISCVGYNNLTQSTFMTFGIFELYEGIPLIVVLVGTYVFPEFLKNLNVKFKSINSSFMWSLDKINEFFRYRNSVIRGTLIGFIGGMIPSLTVVISSNMAYFVEKYIQIKKKQYREKGDVRSLISAETANNAGAISCLIPLLIFAMPITASEGLIYEIIIQKGIYFGNNSLIYNWIIQLGCYLLIINFIAFLIAYPLAKYLFYFFKIKIVWHYSLMSIILIVSILYLGHSENNLLLYISTFIILSIFGLIIRKLDTLPFIFGFIIQNNFHDSLIRTIILYFT